MTRNKKDIPVNDAHEASAQQSAEAQAHEEEILEEVQEVQEAVEYAAEDLQEKDPLEQAVAEAQAMKDKYLRLQAEWDNFRKRTQEQAVEQRARATQGLMEDVLPVLDDFERAISHAVENGAEGLVEGVQAISTKLNEVLFKHGLEIIDPAGEAFDAMEHQAVATVEDTSVPDETVSQVYQKGYRLGGKVIRSAMVVVSSGGEKRVVEDEVADN
ncbi:MAG: nucleotide exchange factor GrpE [Eggerthellaceae bacterium]|nr:nucleotide exchange factor GrpE [Eggerthellaceae bacterium]